MGVYIKNMDMPRACIDGHYYGNCPMDRVWCAQRFAPEGRSQADIFRDRKDKVPDWCPLRPLPEKHGMLIDADKAIENIMIRQRALKDSTGNVDSGLFTRDIEICIKEQPTLSPADVKPVVTCGKCKYGKYTGASWFCDKHSGHADKFGEDASYHEYHSKYWFCADGEEKNHA